MQRIEDYDGRLTDEQFDVFTNFAGPRQSFFELSVEHNKEFFAGVLYE